MVFDNPLRQGLTHPVVGDVGGLSATGMMAVPEAPGLGIALDPEALGRHLIRD
jgi:L-alanine-DL-glutamate epimerase-like enolase superfamily enzyme